jgi:hypothetical protein
MIVGNFATKPRRANRFLRGSSVVQRSAGQDTREVLVQCARSWRLQASSQGLCKRSNKPVLPTATTWLDEYSSGPLRRQTGQSSCPPAVRGRVRRRRTHVEALLV